MKEVILSHVNIDFDGLASIIAAKKIHPQAQMVISANQNKEVKRFMAIYRDALEIIPDNEVNWTEVRHIILVDVAHLNRVGNFFQTLDMEKMDFTVYDHHPVSPGQVATSAGKIEQVGATVTLLIEELQRNNLPVSAFEATVFGLGIYSDTGCFTFSTTTARDLQAASFLVEQGLDLELVNQYSSQLDDSPQQMLFKKLLLNTQEFELDGLNIVISSHQLQEYIGDVSFMTRKLLEVTGADAVIVIVEMQKQVYVIGRANSGRIALHALMKALGGGGHEQAASAMLKSTSFEDVLKIVEAKLDQMVQPAITAQAIMKSPVQSITPSTSVDEAADIMHEYGYSGLPVVDKDELIGMISRRDLNKATKHDLGHAPIKSYMSPKLITIQLKTTFEEILHIMMEHNIGRLPVVEEGRLIGILTRADVIKVLHNK